MDDYPYLVYSPNAETTSEGGSGGGLVIVTADTNGYPSMSAEEIAENANVGKLVVFKLTNNETNVTKYYQLSLVSTGESKIAIFTSFIVTEGEQENETTIEGDSIYVSTKEAPIVEYAYPAD